MNPKEIFYTLGRCLVLDEDPRALSEMEILLKQPGFNWERMVHHGSNHLVLPALFQKFKAAAFLEWIPADLRDHLNEIYLQNERRNLKILEQVRWLNSLLEAREIRPVFLKGCASLISGVYSHTGDRMLSDIDCVVPEERIPEASDLLKEEGFTHADYRIEDLPFMHHYPTLTHPDAVAAVDLHFFPVAKSLLSFVDHWEDRTIRVEQPDNTTLEIPGSMDMIRLNFLHSQIQDLGDYYAQVSLKNLYEFHRLISTEYREPKMLGSKRGLNRKFTKYSLLAARTFHSPQEKASSGSLLARWYLFRFDGYKTNRTYAQLDRFLRKILYQLRHYIYILVRSPFRRSYRRYVYSRLRDPAWPDSHRAHLRKHF